MTAAVDLVLDRLGIPARRKGGRWWTERCPLPTHRTHNAAHAWVNFFVRDNEAERPGQWHCFSCKSGGTLVELVESVLDLDRSAALEWLRGVADREPPPVVRVRFDPVGPRRFRMPAGVEVLPIDEWNSVPRDYLFGRKVTPDQISRWGICYALEGRLEGRVVVPIRTQAGALANYAARTFVGDETRYLAASEREHPDKDALLGEEFWRTGARDVVVAFEGAMNGLAIERALRGIPVDLAGLQGSAVNHRRLSKLGTFRRVVVATDPDRAGDFVAREIAAGIGRRIEVRRAEYPEAGVDANDTPPARLREAIVRCL